jgi:hypothetical protein
MIVGASMNLLFYDQMVAIFSIPFGEMTEEELAMAILNASETQAVSNDEANDLFCHKQAIRDPYNSY